MDERQFHSEVLRAQTLSRLDPDKQDYYAGYIRGLRRRYHGATFGTDAEHATWLALVDDADESRAARGRGYCDGFAGPQTEEPGTTEAADDE